MKIIFGMLVSLTVALIGWAVGHFIVTWIKNEKRRLHQRLSGEAAVERAEQARSIVLSQARAKATSGKLTQKFLLGSLIRKLSTIYPNMPPSRFLLICGSAALGAFCLGALMLNSLPIGLIAGVVAGYIPILVVSQKAGARQRAFTEQLPEAMDFLSRTLRAGHSLSTGLQMMGTELPEPTAGEFRRCYDQHSLGQSMDDCLRDMAGRIQSPDFSFFVTTVLIQRQTGGDLSHVLGNISSMVRGRMRLRQYVKAKTAEGRFTGYILVAFPAVMFFLAYSMNPDYGGTLLHTDTGHKLLATAGGLQLMGLWSIRKLTTVKV